eukprot:TRINITY_DN14802_c0_g1_i1.p1 TRINITY_DN14802_c0_g1~~TRINITY_DN14802_c0_g1_i1.p1  ORF type:complete len:575 (-),score=46.88 TRINITY_DN14802_c0_g1_i1:44-1768(-)
MSRLLSHLSRLPSSTSRRSAFYTHSIVPARRSYSVYPALHTLGSLSHHYFGRVGLLKLGVAGTAVIGCASFFASGYASPLDVRSEALEEDLKLDADIVRGRKVVAEWHRQRRRIRQSLHHGRIPFPHISETNGGDTRNGWVLGLFVSALSWTLKPCSSYDKSILSAAGSTTDVDQCRCRDSVLKRQSSMVLAWLAQEEQYVGELIDAGALDWIGHLSQCQARSRRSDPTLDHTPSAPPSLYPSPLSLSSYRHTARALANMLSSSNGCHYILCTRDEQARVRMFRMLQRWCDDDDRHIRIYGASALSGLAGHYNTAKQQERRGDSSVPNVCSTQFPPCSWIITRRHLGMCALETMHVVGTVARLAELDGDLRQSLVACGSIEHLCQLVVNSSRPDDADAAHYDRCGLVSVQRQFAAAVAELSKCEDGRRRLVFGPQNDASILSPWLGVLSQWSKWGDPELRLLCAATLLQLVSYDEVGMVVLNVLGFDTIYSLVDGISDIDVQRAVSAVLEKLLSLPPSSSPPSLLSPPDGETGVDGGTSGRHRDGEPFRGKGVRTTRHHLQEEEVIGDDFLPIT